MLRRHDSTFASAARNDDSIEVTVSVGILWKYGALFAIVPASLGTI